MEILMFLREFLRKCGIFPKYSEGVVMSLMTLSALFIIMSTELKKFTYTNVANYLGIKNEAENFHLYWMGQRYDIPWEVLKGYGDISEALFFTTLLLIFAYFLISHLRELFKDYNYVMSGYGIRLVYLVGAIFEALSLTLMFYICVVFVYIPNIILNHIALFIPAKIFMIILT